MKKPKEKLSIAKPHLIAVTQEACINVTKDSMVKNALVVVQDIDGFLYTSTSCGSEKRIPTPEYIGILTILLDNSRLVREDCVDKKNKADQE